MLSQACQAGELAACLGKDRFAVLLPRATEEQAVQWSQDFLTSIAQREHAIGESKVRMTGSSGVVEFGLSLTAEKAVEIAEQVLDLAKASGRNCTLTHQSWEKDAESWNETAAGGKLFSTTLARDVMIPWQVFLGIDETVEQGQAVLEQTRLSALPVVDREGKFAGLVPASQLTGKSSRPAKARNSGSVRILRHYMAADVPRFDESATLADSWSSLPGNKARWRSSCCDQRPSGLVYCQSLAAAESALGTRTLRPFGAICHDQRIPASTGFDDRGRGMTPEIERQYVGGLLFALPLLSNPLDNFRVLLMPRLGHPHFVSAGAPIMQIILFEDEFVPRLYPITVGRPAYNVSRASYRLIDWATELAAESGATLRGVVRPHLASLQQEIFPNSRLRPRPMACRLC